MATLAITPQSRIAERVLGAYFRLPLEEGTFREDTAPEFSPDTLALCDMFGMTPVKLHYAGADRRLQCEAFIVNDPADRRIYLTNHVKSPERALIGHELVHRMRREHPKLYDSLVRALGDAGEAHDRWVAYYTAMREQTQRKEGRALSNDEIREEGVADLVGDLLLDPAVWRALRQPNLLQRVADWIGSVWRRLRGTQAPVDPLGGGGLIRDRKRAMAAVTRVLGDWADSLARPSPAEPGFAPAADSPTLRRDPNAPEGVFRSALLDALVAGQGAPAQAPWQQWLGWLDGAQRRGAFKASERTWLGLDDWMGQWKGPIPRQSLVDYVRTHQVQINEVVLEESREAAMARLAGEFEQQGYTLSTEEHPGEEDCYLVTYFDPEGDEITSESLPPRLQALVWAANQGVVPEAHLRYQLPGGRNYRELLLALPEAGDSFAIHIPNVGLGIHRFESREAAQEAIDRGRLSGVSIVNVSEATNNFHSSHYDHPNVLAHVRFNERTDTNGARVLFLEEIQSDWHQKGRREGYGVLASVAATLRWGGIMPDEWARMDLDRQRQLRQRAGADGAKSSAVPDAPFKSTDDWAMLVFKRMVIWAAEHGFDRVAWTTGEQQAERYDLSKRIELIRVTTKPDGSRRVRIHIAGSAERPAFDVRSDGAVEPDSASSEPFRGKSLDEVIGKDMAEKVMAVDGRHDFAGDDLKVGGSGMRAFYDKILPAAVNKWAKKFGGMVGQAEVCAGPRELFIDGAPGEYVVRDSLTMEGVVAPVPTMVEAEAYCHAVNAMKTGVTIITPVLDITPAMRDAALAGLPMFRRQADMEHESMACDALPAP